MNRIDSFNEFTKAVIENIEAFMPGSFKAVDISVNTVVKNNGVKLTGLCIRNNSNICPTIYLEQFYQRYVDGEAFDRILQTIADIRIANDNADFDTSLFEFANCRYQIMPRLIGAEHNQELLSERPHVLIADLAVVFAINLGTSDNGSGLMSVPINNNMSEIWGVSTRELYDLAIDNLAKSDTGYFKSVEDEMSFMLMPKMIMEYGSEEAAKEALLLTKNTDMKIYLITNTDKLNGAAQVLNPVMMKKVTDTLGTDIYILPSSIHECIVIPAKRMNVRDLESMVRDINANVVIPEERLSDSVYTYTLEEGIKKA